MRRIWQSFDWSFELAMQTLDHSVGTRTIWCGPNAVNAEQYDLWKRSMEHSLRGSGRWNIHFVEAVDGTFRSHPAGWDLLRNENAGDSFSCDVNNRNGYRPTDKTINKCKEMLKKIWRRKRSNNIDVHVIKTSIRGSESTKLCSSVTIDLSLVFILFILKYFIQFLCMHTYIHTFIHTVYYSSLLSGREYKSESSCKCPC